MLRLRLSALRIAMETLRIVGKPQADLRVGIRMGKFGQDLAKGSAVFNRVEGIFHGEDGSICFASTYGRIFGRGGFG